MIYIENIEIKNYNTKARLEFKTQENDIEKKVFFYECYRAAGIDNVREERYKQS